jgi:hypothetical protein
MIELIAEVNSLTNIKETIDDGLDILYTAVWDAIGVGDVEGIDNAFETLNPSELNIHSQLGLLTSTYIFRDLFKNRLAFLDRCVEFANQNGTNRPGLFEGLK